jgi:hypothetical protein
MKRYTPIRQILLTLVLVCTLAFSAACGDVISRTAQVNSPTATHRAEYRQLERGDSAAGQSFGDWVVETSHGLIQDSFVRDNNKLGVVITSQVRPDEVKGLAQSLAQGFRKSFPDQNLSILVYAPDKQLILTARYENASKQIEYQLAG